MRRGLATLASRARALAENNAAAHVWEKINALAAHPGRINMSQGFPDFEGSPVARRVAAEAIADGSVAGSQYTQQPGSPVLREAVAAFIGRRHGARINAATDVVVTAGAQEALVAAFLTYCDPGDEVVIFEPCYPFMLGAIRLAGAVPRCVTLRDEAGFTIDEEALRAAASSPRAKMLVLNTPQNPTGHVATRSELELVGAVCREYGLLAIADDVYEHCLFGGVRHQRFCVLDPTEPCPRRLGT